MTNTENTIVIMKITLVCCKEEGRTEDLRTTYIIRRVCRRNYKNEGSEGKQGRKTSLNYLALVEKLIFWMKSIEKDEGKRKKTEIY